MLAMAGHLQFCQAAQLSEASQHDIKLQLACSPAVAIVGDITITHPFLGLLTAHVGSLLARMGRVCPCTGAKNSLYKSFHTNQSLLFILLWAWLNVCRVLMWLSCSIALPTQSS